MDLKIKEMTPDLLDNFLYYFDEIGFADNPDWSVCYCQFYHFPGTIKEWEKRSKEENRNASIDLICSGKMSGFIAYQDDDPVGWCNANLRENYEKIPYEDDSPDSQGKKIAGIVCFLIAHTHRRQNVARQLLQYIILNFKDKGYDIIEAYPRKGKLSDAHSYRGPITLYESEGFTLYKEFPNFNVMRKILH